MQDFLVEPEKQKEQQVSNMEQEAEEPDHEEPDPWEQEDSEGDSGFTSVPGNLARRSTSCSLMIPGEVVDLEVEESAVDLDEVDIEEVDIEEVVSRGIRNNSVTSGGY